MSNDVSKFISKLDKLSGEGIEVFVPSKQETITVSPLNLKQQKDLISSVLDGVKGTLDFSRTLNNIILDNSGRDDLKIFDKIPFTIGMRVQALGTKYITGEDKVDLQVVLDNIKKTKLQFKKEKLIEYKNLKINLAVPTLKDENALLKKGASDLGPSETADYKEEVSVLYMLEMVKYIKELEIEEVAVNMPDVKITDRINLVEKLPLAIYTDIADYIEAVTSYNTGLLTVGNNKVSIDALFFDSGSAE